jgi:toxin YoeB
MNKTWSDKSWEHYVYWQNQDKKTLRKINTLLKDIDRNGYDGMGKPEKLKGNWAGWWSLHIDEQNRLIFRIRDNIIEIAACLGHYDDK